MSDEHNSNRDEIRPISSADLPAVAAVHLAAFPESAMSLLGARVVQRYYEWQLEGPHPEPFAVGCWREGRLEGFLFGGVRRDAVSGFARHYLPSILVAAATHPRGTIRLVGPKLRPVLRLMVRRRPKVTGEPIGDPAARAFGVLAIAVAPAAQGTGGADLLIDAAEARARGLGFTEMRLSVEAANRRAVRFYERHGWTSHPNAPGRMFKTLS